MSTMISLLYDCIAFLIALHHFAKFPWLSDYAKYCWTFFLNTMNTKRKCFGSFFPSFDQCNVGYEIWQAINLRWMRKLFPRELLKWDRNFKKHTFFPLINLNMSHQSVLLSLIHPKSIQKCWLSSVKKCIQTLDFNLLFKLIQIEIKKYPSFTKN